MERDALSSSDDDDDRENLIDQNDRKHPSHLHPPSSPNSPTRHPFSSLELDSSSIRRHLAHSFAKKKHYYVLLAISLPLLVILVFFSADIKSLFSSAFVASSRNDAAAASAPLLGRMRESELRALFLLRQQQDSLLSLFSNQSSGNHRNAPREELESAVLNQISLNKQIQEALLAAHRSDFPGPAANSSDSEGLTADYRTCRALVPPAPAAGRVRMEWRPRPGKFLFAICLSGQMSNHLICLQKHMFFAALMGRALVIPSPHFDYLYSRVIEIEHINECLNGGKEKFVVSFDEFVRSRKNHPHIDRFYCYFAKPVPCFVDEDHVKKLKGIGVSVSGKMETPFTDEDTQKPGNRTVEEVKEKFGGVGEDVVAIGDVFFANVEENWVLQPGGPIAHKCKTLIEPSRLILLTAQRFVQTFLGRDFVALHFRRHGWLKFCNAKKPSCFYSVPQAADCIARVVAKTNAPVIYLSTDAPESETGLLQSLLVVNGKAVPLVKRPPPSSGGKWDALLYRHHIEGDNQVEAMLDKTICAMSTVFIGASGSTFTEDILRLRKDWGTASSCDEYLCQGELPNFIADDE